MLWRYNVTDTRDIDDAGKRTERYLDGQKKTKPAGLPTECFGSIPRSWCPARDLNPHSACAKKDFKSVPETCSGTNLRYFQLVLFPHARRQQRETRLRHAHNLHSDPHVFLPLPFNLNSAQ